MSLAVVGTASSILCSYGSLSTPLIVLPDRTVMAEHMLMGNITDMEPFANIEPFGLCSSPLNPAVILATIENGGILTPQPCLPFTTDSWTTGAVNVLVEGSPALDEEATLMCVWEGEISIVDPGNSSVMVP